MDSSQNMNVCLNHTDFKNVRTLRSGDSTEKTAEELRQADINKRRPISGRPDYVEVKAVVHPSQ